MMVCEVSCDGNRASASFRASKVDLLCSIEGFDYVAFELALVSFAPTEAERCGALEFARVFIRSLQYWELDDSSI